MKRFVVRARPGSLGAVLAAVALLGGSFASALPRNPASVPSPPVSDAPDPPPVVSGRGDEASSGPTVPADAGDEPMRSRPIATSVDRAVDAVMRKHFACGAAGEGTVPCFPVTVERKWQYSVADSLRHLEFDDSPSPSRPPTAAEMSGVRPGPLSASGSVALDPVCKGRQLLKALTGRTRTYYLYRVWDATGERAILRDRPFDATELGPAPLFHYVGLGSFQDECEAVAAWRRAVRETRARREDDDGAASRGTGEETLAAGHGSDRTDEAEGAATPEPGAEDPGP